MTKPILIYLVVGIVLLFSPLAVTAQDDPKEVARQFLEIGDEIYYEQKAPEVAKEMYIQAAQTDPNSIKANYMAGKTILETINKGEATPYFLKVYELDTDYRFDILYSVARAYQYDLKFNEAINFYNSYLQKLNKEKDYRGEDKVPVSQVRRRIYECENGLEFVNNARNFKITNIGGAVNSNSKDYAPVINADETVLIFTSRRAEGNLNENVFDDNFYYEDIFISKKVNGEWSAAKNIGGTVNTLYFDSNLALSADGKQLYLYKDGDNGDGNIYLSELQDNDTWSNPKPLGSNINSSYTENSVSISPDDKTLYFTSDRPGGYGGYDIYRCEKDRRGEWGKVTNLGQIVNTPYNEEGVFIGHDGKTLYFSSRGHKGMGGYDIFKATYDEEKLEWGEPVNLGYPINTPDDDVYFVTTKDETSGYYATVRNDGFGYLDLYKVEIPDLSEDLDALAKQGKNELTGSDSLKNNRDIKPIDMAPKPTIGEVASLKPVQLLLKVDDGTTAQAMNATVSLKSRSGGNTVAAENVATGIYRFDIFNEQPAEYVLAVQKNGYIYKSLQVSVPGATSESQEFRRKVSLNPITADYRMVLNFVYFDFNSANLKEESYDELDRLKQFVLSSMGTSIEIAGHTDNVGPKAYNQQLSQARAQAIVDYLVAQGVTVEQLIAKGYGEDDPIASNDDEKDGRELNRRVEMRVLDTKPIATQ